MMDDLPVICVRCTEELTEPGALFITSPEGNSQDSYGAMHVWKYHLCKTCEKVVLGRLLDEAKAAWDAIPDDDG